MSQRGPYAKGIAKRREIIDVTLDIVARRGWRQTSNAEIASRVGLSQAGLVHYYGTREELAIAVLQSKDQYDRQTFFDPNPSFDGFWNGVWGLYRSYGQRQTDLYSLPGSAACSHQTWTETRSESGSRSISSQR